MKKFLCFTVILVLCLSLAACGQSSKNEKQTETTAAATEAPAKEKVFKSGDKRFQITADGDWKDAEDVLKIKDATLSISKNVQEYIVLINESKYNFSDKLSGYTHLVVKHMEKNIDGEKATEPEEMKLGKYGAYKTNITGKVDDIDTNYSIYCAEIGDRYIQLVCWSTGTRDKAIDAEFDKIAKTLSPVKE